MKYKTFKLDLGMSFEQVRDFYMSHPDPMMREVMSVRTMWGYTGAWDVHVWGDNPYNTLLCERQEMGEDILRMVDAMVINVKKEGALIDIDSDGNKIETEYMSAPGTAKLHACVIVNENLPYSGFIFAEQWSLLCFGVQHQDYFRALQKDEPQWVVGGGPWTHYTPKYCSACMRSDCWDEAHGWFPAVSTGDAPNLVWGYTKRIERRLLIKP